MLLVCFVKITILLCKMHKIEKMSLYNHTACDILYMIHSSLCIAGENRSFYDTGKEHVL